MPRLKKMVAKYLCIISALMVIVLLAVYISGQVYSANHLAKESANKIFQQMDQMLTQNQNDIEEMKKEYSQTCLHNAETVAYIIQSDPKALDSAEKLKKIAEFVEIDEIHIFDETGRIFTGTNPEYYNLTIDSGEQIRFFKPLLNDKSLKLCQEITPNTAENKMMQYSALWSDNGEYIVQVGMEPVNVMKVTEKNELSYIFSLLRATAEVNLYAIDVETGEIKGSTDVNTVGKNLTEIGLTEEKIKNHSDGFYAEINGVKSYCVFSEAEGNYLGRIVPNKVLYSNIPSQLLGLTGCFMLIAIILVVAVMWYINKYVINGIDSVNEKLRAIAEGDLNEKADVQSSLEFSELSSHINDMIESVLSTT
ncbi:MAG: HAMP domain-containing protein, partial [Oscillospiraceae bacterium]